MNNTKIVYWQDGDMIQVNFDDFINLQESIAWFWKTREEALEDFANNIKNETKWISVNNSKPDKTKEIIVAYGNQWFCTSLAKWDEIHSCWMNKWVTILWFDNNITHWHPIPN